MVERGGGVSNMEVHYHQCADGSNMAVVHVHMDTCDAMGANKINAVCQALREPLETITGKEVVLRILSNLADRRLVSAKVVIPDFDPEQGKKIEWASKMAQVDRYRATTHNKGIMNGVDAVLIATGNDWRAVEAGAHAYATRDGNYRGLSEWRMSEDGSLVGELTMPMAVGTVGGSTKVHPQVQKVLELLTFPSSQELARIIVATGLIQNLGALKALTSNGGINEGHLKQHVRIIAASSGAMPEEMQPLIEYLREVLREKKDVTEADAQEWLAFFRNGMN